VAVWRNEMSSLCEIELNGVKVDVTTTIIIVIIIIVQFISIFQI
jgi:hypothetical protein